MSFDNNIPHPVYVYRSIFSAGEKKMDRLVLAHIPLWMGTHHLTLASVLWSAGVVGAAVLARSDVRWVWAMTGCMFLHFLTDHFDGAVGRLRNTGLVRWGYYMDHLLDYIFLSAVFLGYIILLPSQTIWVMGTYIACSGFMLHSFFLSFVTGRFHISYWGFGPVELWAVLGVCNAVGFFVGIDAAGKFFPILCPLITIGLTAVVYRAQRELWTRDVQARQSKGGGEHAALTAADQKKCEP